MADSSSIPSIPFPVDFGAPTPSAAPGGTVLPPLPSLSSILNSGSTATSAADAGNAADIAAGGTGSDGAYGTGQAVATGASSYFSWLGTWLKSIALPGTLSVVALLLIILSVYIAVTRGK